MLKYFLSFLPIVLLIILSLKLNLKAAVGIVLVITIFLFFYWGAHVPHFAASMVVSMVSTLNILMIVFGAIFLYQVMSGAGLIKEIGASLNDVHPSRQVRFFLIAISLTAFFEGIAGFGTPGAIVPLLLISIGFDAVLSVSIVLMLDALFCVFGAIGTPIIGGFKIPLNLSSELVQYIDRYSALFICLAGIVFIFFILRLFSKNVGTLKCRKDVLMLFIFYFAPFIIFSFIIAELSVVLSAIVMLIASILYLSGGKAKINYKPWMPYLILVFLLLLPKVISPLASFLSYEMTYENLFSTDIAVSFKPLQSPFLPFVVTSLAVFYLKGSQSLPLVETFKKVLSVFLILFPAVAISQLMINSGFEGLSMISYMSDIFSRAGILYVVVAPVIGTIGTFITGSTTVSNIIFGASHLQTAQQLELNTAMIFALQNTGAAIGNAICLFNIVAAASVAGIQDIKVILRNNLLATVLAAVLVGVVGLIIFTLNN